MSVFGTVRPPETPEELEQAARMLIARAGSTCCRIVRCETDSILFLNGVGRPMTAWVWHVNGQTRVTYEPGFAAEPSAEMVPVELR